MIYFWKILNEKCESPTASISRRVSPRASRRAAGTAVLHQIERHGPGIILIKVLLQPYPQPDSLTCWNYTSHNRLYILWSTQEPKSAHAHGQQDRQTVNRIAMSPKGHTASKRHGRPKIRTSKRHIHQGWRAAMPATAESSARLYNFYTHIELSIWY